MNIFKIESGLDYVGHGQLVDDLELGKSILITNCYNIRRWGTKQGLGELGIKGKQKDTILDPTPPITVPISRIILKIDIHKSVQNTFTND